MKPANASGAIERVKTLVPRWRKGVWIIDTLPVAVYPGESASTAAEFAAIIRASLSAHRDREDARPKGDGLVPSGAPGSRRVRGTAQARPKGWPAGQTAPRSTLHVHSKRCIEPMVIAGRYPDTGAVADPGWVKCKHVPYPFHPMHEHRTPRGRTFLVSHLPGIPCPFDGGQS